MDSATLHVSCPSLMLTLSRMVSGRVAGASGLGFIHLLSTHTHGMTKMIYVTFFKLVNFVSTHTQTDICDMCNILKKYPFITHTHTHKYIHMYTPTHTGLSLDFSQAMFSSWLAEKDMNNVATALKKCGLEAKLLVGVVVVVDVVVGCEATYYYVI